MIYHKAGPSKMKNCSDVDHFHMISWHHDHPTCEYGFSALKKLLRDKGQRSYDLLWPKVYSPYGLCQYFEAEPDKRKVINAYDLTTDHQKQLLRRLTNKTIAEAVTDEDTELTTKSDTLRGKKYDFIVKMMKK